MQLETWAVDLGHDPQLVEAYHVAFYCATNAVRNLSGKENKS